MRYSAMIDNQGFIALIASAHKGRRKKFLNSVGICSLLGICTLIVVRLNASPMSQSSEPVRWGSDRTDLEIPRPKSGCSVTGKVTINGQFPLGIGHVIGYDGTMTRALAYSRIDKKGKYVLRDVPPIKLILLVKREITDDPNPVLKQMLADLGESQARTQNPKVPAAKKTTLGDLLKKQPSRNVISRVRFEVSSPEVENIPEVQWMTAVAFLKYGGVSDEPRFTLTPEGNETICNMNLIVP